MKGIILGGGVGSILVREKQGGKLEIGELLVAENSSSKMVLQVFDLEYGSQFSRQDVELMSGLRMDEGVESSFFDAGDRTYVIAKLKSLLTIKNDGEAHSSTVPSKFLPDFFSSVRGVVKEDLSFLSSTENSLFFGMVRSGSKILDVPVFLDGHKVLSHHVLVSGTTGRGKSVFLSTLLWELAKQEWCGVLVLDPHDEYIGRRTLGLKDHPLRDRIVYYSMGEDILPGGRSLKINISSLLPHHFDGVVDWSDAQSECVVSYYRRNPSGWVEDILREVPLIDVNFHESTLSVVKRRIIGVLGVSLVGDTIVSSGVFDALHGTSTISEIVSLLRSGHLVILDTSQLSGRSEILVGSCIASEVLRIAKSGDSRLVSILIEEAPRVLGSDVLQRGSNIFATIAREGRKFGVGLIAVTQLPSLIPRSILANMNTKVILGTEMKPERVALIESASQDLSEDDRAIASLDRGEAIITSNFSRLAIPVKFLLFEDHAKNDIVSKVQKKLFGV